MSIQKPRINTLGWESTTYSKTEPDSSQKNAGYQFKQVVNYDELNWMLYCISVYLDYFNSDEIELYVDTATGDDSNLGSSSAKLATIEEAMSRAPAGKKTKIFVVAGTYEIVETVDLENAVVEVVLQDGVLIQHNTLVDPETSKMAIYNVTMSNSSLTYTLDFGIATIQTDRASTPLLTYSWGQHNSIIEAVGGNNFLKFDGDITISLREKDGSSDVGDGHSAVSASRGFIDVIHTATGSGTILLDPLSESVSNYFFDVTKGGTGSLVLSTTSVIDEPSRTVKDNPINTVWKLIFTDQPSGGDGSFASPLWGYGDASSASITIPWNPTSVSDAVSNFNSAYRIGNTAMFSVAITTNSTTSAIDTMTIEASPNLDIPIIFDSSNYTGITDLPALRKVQEGKITPRVMTGLDIHQYMPITGVDGNIIGSIELDEIDDFSEGVNVSISWTSSNLNNVKLEYAFLTGWTTITSDAGSSPYSWDTTGIGTGTLFVRAIGTTIDGTSTVSLLTGITVS